MGQDVLTSCTLACCCVLRYVETVCVCYMRCLLESCPLLYSVGPGVSGRRIRDCDSSHFCLASHHAGQQDFGPVCFALDLCGLFGLWTCFSFVCCCCCKPGSFSSRGAHAICCCMLASTHSVVRTQTAPCPSLQAGRASLLQLVRPWRKWWSGEVWHAVLRHDLPAAVLLQFPASPAAAACAACIKQAIWHAL